MEKRRQRRKEQLRNRTVALAAGLLLAGVCGVSSALAATGGSDGFDVVDVLQDTASLSAAPSSLVPAEDDALWQVAAEGGSDAALKEIASRGANLLAARSGGQRAVEGMRITTALIKVEGVLDQNLANDSSFSVDFNKQFTLHIEVERGCGQLLGQRPTPPAPTASCGCLSYRRRSCRPPGRPLDGRSSRRPSTRPAAP